MTGGQCIMKTVLFYQKRLKNQLLFLSSSVLGSGPMYPDVRWACQGIVSALCHGSSLCSFVEQSQYDVTRALASHYRVDAGVRTVDLFFGRILFYYEVHVSQISRTPSCKIQWCFTCLSKSQVTSLVQMIELGGVTSEIWKKLWSSRVPQLGIWVSISRSKWVGEPD